MLIASQKKKENIAEYLLYLWQIEDLLRACRFDMHTIQQQIIDKYDQSEDVKKQMSEWYENLVNMMQNEQVTQQGHLSISQNILTNLTDLHLRLLKSPQETLYISAYYSALPFIVELRSKAGENVKGEIETCFSAMYGVLLLKLQQKKISDETQAAIHQIGKLLSILAEKYNKNTSEIVN
ncbi:MAG: DUF4924 family protein [Bacteroidales bacterium]|jgi:hypothetical protein|nr:DUF4924 family protein [Bacteroidales bacterium]